MSKNCADIIPILSKCSQKKVHTLSRYYPKQCIYTAWILYWYFPNIVQILSKYYPNIIKTSSRYCPNTVKILCQTLAIYSPNIVWILPVRSPNIVKIFSKYGPSIIQILSRYCSNIVEILCKTLNIYWPNIVWKLRGCFPELQKLGILVSRIPDIFGKKSGHFQMIAIYRSKFGTKGVKYCYFKT